MENELNLIRTAIDANPLSRFHVRLVLLVLVIMIMDGYNIQAISYAAPFLSAHWHLSPGDLGMAFSLGLVGLTLGALILSPAADRFGAKRVLLICIASYAVLTVGTAFVPSLTWLLIARFLTGLGLGGVMPTAISLVTDYSPTRVRTFIITLSMSGFPIGGAIGGVIAASLAVRHGWQAVFLAGGVVPVIILPLLYRYLPESLHFQVWNTQKRINLSRTLAEVIPGYHLSNNYSNRNTTVGEKNLFNPVKGLFHRDYCVATSLIWITFVCNLLLIYFFASWLPTLIKSFGYSLVFASLATSVFQIGGLAGSLILAFLCDKLGKPNLVIAFSLFFIILFCLLLSAYPTSPVALIVGAAGVGFCIIGAQGASNGFVASFYPAPVRSTGIGWALGVGRLGSIVGPFLGGALMDMHMPKVMIFRLAIIPALVAGISIFSVRKRDRSGRLVSARSRS